MINPFVYARLADGQWLVVVGLAGVIYMNIFLIRWGRYNKHKYILIAGLISGITVAFSQHAIFIIAFISFIYFACHWITYKRWQEWGGWLLILAGMLLINSNVIAGYVYFESKNSELITNIDDRHYEVFSSVSHAYASLYTNVVSLHGYWGEADERFLSTQENVFIWKPLFILLCFLILVGFWHIRRQYIAWFILISGGLAYVLALGMENIFSRLLEFLYATIPYYSGMREPHKWIGVVLIAYIVFMASGFQWLSRVAGFKKYIHVWGSIFCLFIVLYTPTVIFGFYGQLKPQKFPDEWASVQAQYGCKNIQGRILFLPWHQYMKMDFLGDKKVITPARGFFGPCVLQGDNMEMGSIYTQSNREESRILEGYFRKTDENNDHRQEIVHDLKRMQVQYIILSKSEDYTDYLWIENIQGIDTEFSGDHLLVLTVR
jgi:hypothetical protein